MKSMKLWMGVAAAVALATGCGGTSPEDACDQALESAKKFDSRMSSCVAAEGLTMASDYDKATCVAEMKDCSDDDLEASLSLLDCVLNAMTCEAFSDEDAAMAMLTKLQTCETKYPVSAACGGGSVDVGGNALRKAKSIRANR